MNEKDVLTFLKEWCVEDIPKNAFLRSFDKTFMLRKGLSSGLAQIAFGVEDPDFYLPIWYFWIKDGKVENIYIPTAALDDDDVKRLYNLIFPYDANDIKKELYKAFVGKEFNLN